MCDQCGQECVSFQALAQHKNKKHTIKSGYCHAFGIFGSSVSHLLIILNELSPQTVSNIGFCSFSFSKTLTIL